MIHNSRIAHSEQLSVGANPVRQSSGVRGQIRAFGLAGRMENPVHSHQIAIPAKMVASDHTFMRERD
jgi:hypothetical protein